MKKILMVALDFPPCQSAGVQRTTKFIQYLPEFGWEPSVLTGQPHIYDQLADVWINPAKPVYRAFGLNTLKHLSLKGKHFDGMLKPDRFFSWYWHGVFVGKAAIREQAPDVIWSTFPCSTAMKIALKLQHKSGLPWVADFRDPFAGVNPYFNIDNRAGSEIDEAVVRSADMLVFSTHRTAALYLAAYPFLSDLKVHVITNGFNEEEFVAAESRVRTSELDSDRSVNKRYTLLHSGALYSDGRDPRYLFQAIAELIQEHGVARQNLSVVFRGAILTPNLKAKLEELKLIDIIEFWPAIPFEQSIDEMLTADALLLLQGEQFNNQIPGKAYEYLRSGKPILALTDKTGATAELIDPYEGVYIAGIQYIQEIKEQLLCLINNRGGIRIDRDIECYSRKSTTGRLANLLDELA